VALGLAWPGASLLVVFGAGIVRGFAGFAGFGCSALCVAGLSLFLPRSRPRRCARR
jgi:hypothetical protein